MNRLLKYKNIQSKNSPTAKMDIAFFVDVIPILYYLFLHGGRLKKFGISFRWHSKQIQNQNNLLNSN